MENILRGPPSGGETRMKQERRKCTRFQPEDQTFVVVRPDFTKLGSLLDISERGLSFQHSAGTVEKDCSVQIDIFKGDNSFYLSKVTGTVVYDRKENSDFCFEHCRCGVQFGALTEEQVAWLSDYIQRSAKGNESRGPENLSGK